MYGGAFSLSKALIGLKALPYFSYDGGAILVLASKTALERYQLNTIARLIGGVWTGGEAWRFSEVPIFGSE